MNLPKKSSPYNPELELVKPALEYKVLGEAFKPGRSRQSSILIHLENKRPRKSVGNKAMNLWHLQKQGFRVPDTHILTWEAYEGYLEDPREILENIKIHLEQTLDPDQSYAVPLLCRHRRQPGPFLCGSVRLRSGCPGRRAGVQGRAGSMERNTNRESAILHQKSPKMILQPYGWQ